MKRIFLLAALFAAAILGFGATSAQAAHQHANSDTGTVILVDGQESHDAFTAWSFHTNITMQHTEVCSGPHCIHLETVDTTPCDSGFEIGMVVAGCSFGNADGSCTSEIESFDVTYGYEFALAATEHELGHCLGLSHNTTDPRSIMTPVIDPSNPPSGPDHNDRAAVQALYPLS